MAVIATLRSVSLSASEKELTKRLATVSPAGLVLSSVTAAREGLPLAVGALLESRSAVRVLSLESPMGAAVVQAAEGVACGPDRGTGELLKESNEAGISAGVAAPEGQAADVPAGKPMGVGQQCAAVDS